MNPTLAKFSERCVIVAVVAGLGFVADQANTLGPYGVAVGAVASMLLLVVGKLAPKPAPAAPAIPPAPTPADRSASLSPELAAIPAGCIRTADGWETPPLLTRVAPAGEFKFMDGTPGPAIKVEFPDVVTPAMRAACRSRGLAYPTTAEDRAAARELAAKDAAYEKGGRPEGPAE